MTFEDLTEKTKSLSNHDQKLIKNAYDFAVMAHKNQIRGTGESWIVHPLSAAITLAKNELDAETISAALLHDVPEDTKYTIEDIKKKFGQNIANLVDGVTKLEKIKIKKSWFPPVNFIKSYTVNKKIQYHRHIESLRKMLLAMNKDIRVILIKLADRLHNMQTLEGVRQQKRERIARETLEIYAPIAYRLGMGQLKGELEDLSFPFAYPNEYKQTLALAGKSYKHKEKYTVMAKRSIENILGKNHIDANIDGRKKHLFSLWKKLQRYDGNIDKIYDIIALRIVVNSTEECYKVLGLIHKNFKPLIGRIKDYIAVPKPNGYQSLHTTVFLPKGEIIEMQIRSKEMHEKAEMGIAAHWHYSEHIKSKIPKNESIEWLNELAKWQEKLTDENEWKRGLILDFFEDRIFAFTPQGDVIDLPNQATPIDFAYAIHTELGNQCMGAKVNGKIVKLGYQLHNGDIVDIISDKKSKGPKRDWLRLVKTQKARSKIRSVLEKGLSL